MDFKIITPPRNFEVGHRDHTIKLSHVMNLTLAPDEQVTLITERGGELDICRKDWGYYATPSLNGRLKEFGYKCCLVDSGGKKFIHIVEEDNLECYHEYLAEHNIKIVAWLDEDSN